MEKPGHNVLQKVVLFTKATFLLKEYFHADWLSHRDS